MARRDDHHRHHHHHHRQLQYASILPASANVHDYHDPRIVGRSNEHERQRALYIEFENAFQDQSIHPDYFGLQSSEQVHLQSVQTISEIENPNLIPYIRYQAAARDPDHLSTPSDTPPHQSRYNHRPNPPPAYPHRFLSAGNRRDELTDDFNRFSLLHTNDNQDVSTPSTSDARRMKTKQPEIIPNPSTQLKLILPQYFLVKYLGRTFCSHLWGSKSVRTPIDDMVRAARQLSSMNEMPTLEACVNMNGFTLTHRHSPVRSKRHQSPERHQHGLIPLENISYVMHDVKYSKIASCIVLRQPQSSSSDHQPSTETLTECYAFLFQSKEHARRFALALAEAFNAQKQSARPSRQDHTDKREGRSPQRRSRHRTQQQQQHHHHLRDSHV